MILAKTMYCSGLMVVQVDLLQWDCSWNSVLVIPGRNRYCQLKKLI